MSKPHHSRQHGVDDVLSRAIEHPVRRALAEPDAGSGSAPPHRFALRRAGHPWPATGSDV